jgi:hypothetical protein
MSTAHYAREIPRFAGLFGRGLSQKYGGIGFQPVIPWDCPQNIADSSGAGATRFQQFWILDFRFWIQEREIGEQGLF